MKCKVEKCLCRISKAKKAPHIPNSTEKINVKVDNIILQKISINY